MAVIRTVLGDIAAEVLGRTLCHEHVIIDLRGVFKPPCCGDECFADEPVKLENLGWVRLNYTSNWDNLGLSDESTAVYELNLYKAAGGAGLVEVTPAGMGRDPEGLVRVARRTGLQIVMGCGYYVEPCHPAELAERSEAQIADELIGDVTQGVGESGVRAGIIGEIGCSWPLRDGERKVLRAAARAQQATGAAITIHPGRDPEAPFEILDVIEGAGGDAGRTVMGHLDRTIHQRDKLHDLARRGCYLEFDMFGMESAYYPFGKMDLPNDGRRIDLLKGLADAGYGDRLLVSHDTAFKHLLVRYGGTGYGHILRHAVPKMLDKGLGQDGVDAILIHNPRCVLSLPDQA